MLARVLFAPDAPVSDKLLGVALILIWAGFVFVLGWVILKVLRLSKGAAGAVGEDIARASLAKAGDSARAQVVFRFTTYTGYGLWLVQSTHTYTLPQDVAQEVLRKLLRHNCTWGLLGPGLIFVPFLSVGEYWQRRREIAWQREGFSPVMPNDSHQDETIG